MLISKPQIERPATLLHQDPLHGSIKINFQDLPKDPHGSTTRIHQNPLLRSTRIHKQPGQRTIDLERFLCIAVKLNYVGFKDVVTLKN